MYIHEYIFFCQLTKSVLLAVVIFFSLFGFQCFFVLDDLILFSWFSVLGLNILAVFFKMFWVCFLARRKCFECVFWLEDWI